jgi:hypothetical protein
MLPRKMLEELGWSEELIAAFGRVDSLLTESDNLAAADLEGIQEVDPGFATDVDVRGEPVASPSLRFRVG